MSKLKNYGTVIVDGSILLNPTDSYGWLSSGETNFYNYNSAIVKKDIIGKNLGCIYMDNNAILSVGGNINLKGQNNSKVTSGTTILDGVEEQNITNYNSPEFIIKNTTEGGVVFNSIISPSVLFDHKGNNFTLYNNGTGSTFVDYDGDGLLDNVDPHPTVPENEIDVCSDLNLDGKVDLLDLVRLKKILVGVEEDATNSADINRDGDANSYDLTFLIKLILAPAPKSE